MTVDVTDHLRRQVPGVFARGLRAAGWGLVHWVLGFAEQVLEVVAPLVLVCGLGWWALPRLAGLVPLDPQARAVADDALAHVPQSLHLAGLWLSPVGMIVDGLLLMALAALLQTMSAIVASEIYNGR